MRHGQRTRVDIQLFQLTHEPRSPSPIWTPFKSVDDKYFFHRLLWWTRAELNCLLSAKGGQVQPARRASCGGPDENRTRVSAMRMRCTTPVLQARLRGRRGANAALYRLTPGPIATLWLQCQFTIFNDK